MHHGQRTAGIPIQPLWGVEHDAWKGGTESQLGDAGSSYGCMGTPHHAVNLSFGRGRVDDVGHKRV
jgi:hypothetical protein